MRRKILLFHRTLKQSGAARQLVSLYRGLDRDRFDPFFVVVHDRSVFYRAELGDARILALEQGKRGKYLEHLRRLLEILDAERPDLIQSFNHRSNRYFYGASLRRRLPPFYASIRNTEQPWQYLALEALAQWRRRALVVNSRAIRAELLRAGVWPGRVVVIPNGVDVEAFRPADPERRLALRHALGASDRDFIVLAVGRVAPQKQLATTLRALASLAHQGRPVRFLNVGINHKPQHRHALLELAASQGISGRCHFAGASERICDYYHLADAMVLASRHEGLPNVVLENMACGGISVVSSAADNDDVVRDGETGFHFPVGDEAALCDRLARVADMDPGHRRAMAEKARKDVAERFSIGAMVHSFEALYDRGVARRLVP